MEILCPISLGELVDKISILRIKIEKIDDEVKIEYAEFEEEKLFERLDKLKLDGIDQFLQQLLETNSKLWEIEDLVREEEKSKSFGKTFVELARSVYVTNDQRFKIKNEINKKYGSEIVEVKSYEKY